MSLVNMKFLESTPGVLGVFTGVNISPENQNPSPRYFLQPKSIPLNFFKDMPDFFIHNIGLVKKILSKEILWDRILSFRQDFGKFLHLEKNFGKFQQTRKNF